MSALADNFSVIQHYNLFCSHNCAYPLCDNKYRAVPGMCLECFSKGDVRLEIQCGEAIIKDIYLWFFYESTGNRKPLFLPSGNVVASLRYFRFKAIRLLINKVKSLSDLGRFFDLFISCIFFAVT